MKVRMMFYLVLVALFGFTGNSFAMEEPPEIVTPGEYDEIIDPQGYEGYNSTLYGKAAGGSITTGIDNSFFGRYAGAGNTTGNDNSFFGRSAGASNINGPENSFFGRSAGYNNTSGGYNSFFGYHAGYSNTGGYNSFFGNNAGYSNTGWLNCFFGTVTGYSNTTGEGNSFFGYRAGNGNTTGDRNSFFGVQAGNLNTTGEENSFFGTNAGFSNKTGSRNVFLGNQAGFNETGSNKLYIENSETAMPLIYGEFDNRLLRINGNFRATATSVSSDKRWKKEIGPIESPLEKVSEIQGVRYRWKVDEFPDRGFTKDRQIGLIAQDVERVLPELVSEDKDGYKSVSYTKLTAVLVEAVKELKTENQKQKEALQQQIQKQQVEIEELRSMIKELKS